MDGYALIDQARSGVENMALDQRLLEAAAECQNVWLRVYRWREPTLSLGYFQPYAQRLAHQPSSSIPVVRRATGGGAIVHHFDWTYCIAVPQDWLSSGIGQGRGGHALGASQPLYDLLHDAVVQWLNELGFAARKWSADCQLAEAQPAVGRQAAFLCFERRSCGDVVWDGQKVMGSAQRRIPGAVLQHGSLLLTRSPYAPNLTGLMEAELKDGFQPQGYPAPAVQAIQGGMPADSPTQPVSTVPVPGAHPWFTAEVFGQRLATAIETAAGMKLTRLSSLAESPLHWDWPKPTRFAESSWTERL